MSAICTGRDAKKLEVRLEHLTIPVLGVLGMDFFSEHMEAVNIVTLLTHTSARVSRSRGSHNEIDSRGGGHSHNPWMAALVTDGAKGERHQHRQRDDRGKDKVMSGSLLTHCVRT